MADPDHRLFAAVVGMAARGAWVQGEFNRARSLAVWPTVVFLAGATARVAYPGDVLADVALFEGDVVGDDRFGAYCSAVIDRAAAVVRARSALQRYAATPAG